MATIQITDIVEASADIQIRDDSPLAKAKLTHLLATASSLIANFSKPVDQTALQTVALGAQFTTPSSLIDGVTSLTVEGGINCDLSFATAADKLLFPQDDFAPDIPISSNQCWVAFELDVALGGTLSASADGFGVAVAAGGKLALSTYTLFASTVPPIPLLKDAIVTALGNFSVSVTPGLLRQQVPGTINASDLSGTLSITGSYEVPLSLGAFATANLPFNFSLSVAPAATAEISGSIAVSGDFLVRSYKVSNMVLQIGVYKKKGTTLTASLAASVGVQVAEGSTDLLGKVLNAALPGVDVGKAGIPDDTAAALNSVIKDSLDRSIAVSLNAACSAATTHEAAVLYEVRLDQGNTDETDRALQAALKGDWTGLDRLTNATRLRNIVVDTKKQQQKLSINLLGFYNSTSVTDYVSKCTILHDETGQLTVIDKESVSRVAAMSTPYSVDADKLRLALAQDFITTASYVAVGSKLNLNLTMVQDYFDYAASMTPQELRDNISLGGALGLIPAGTFDSVLNRNVPLAHARVNVSVHYDNAAALSIFFSDPVKRTPRSRQELENVGRLVMVELLDPAQAVNPARIRILNNVAAWAAMDEDGDVADFVNIPELGGLSQNELAAVGVDWTGIVWWAKTISKVAPYLADTLLALENTDAANFDKNPKFMKRRAALAAILGAVARETKAAFVPTWSPAVISVLSGQHGSAQMDVAWDSNLQHFERGPQGGS